MAADSSGTGFVPREYGRKSLCKSRRRKTSMPAQRKTGETLTVAGQTILDLSTPAHPAVVGHTHYLPLNLSDDGLATNIAEFSLSSLTHGGYVSVAYANRNAACLCHRLPHLQLHILIVLGGQPS